MNQTAEKFFEDLREFIIGATQDAPEAYRSGLASICDLACKMREIYGAFMDEEDDEENPTVPDGWEELYGALVDEIDRVFGPNASSDLTGPLGVMDLGPEHFTMA